MADRKAPWERVLEGGLFASRWLMAPFYIGLVVALVALVVVFVQELAHELPTVLDMNAERAILMALSLIDTFVVSGVLLALMDWVSGLTRKH